MTLSSRIVDPAAKNDRTIGQMLYDDGKLTTEKTDQVLHLQKERGLRFGEAAKLLGFVSEKDVQQMLARQFQFPCLPAEENHLSPDLLAAYQPFSPQVEMLRGVRSEIMLCWLAHGQKSLAVVSATPTETASSIAANLAIVFSQLGKRTVLVDANLREPRLDRIFNLQGTTGLSDVLAGRAMGPYLTNVAPFDDLSVLTAGTVPPNPQELLSRSAFSSLHEDLTRAFEVVLYDCPSFNAGADAFIIGASAKGFLIVAHKDITCVADLKNISGLVSRVDTEIVGTILIDH